MAVAAFALANGTVQAGNEARNVDEMIREGHTIEHKAAQLVELADARCRAGQISLERCNQLKSQVLQQEQVDLMRIKTELDAYVKTHRPKNYKPDAYDKLNDAISR